MNMTFYVSIRPSNHFTIDAKTGEYPDIDANRFTIILLGDENNGFSAEILESRKKIPNNDPFTCLANALNELCTQGVIIDVGIMN